MASSMSLSFSSSLLSSALLRPEPMPKSKPHPPNFFIVPSVVAGAVSDKKRHWKEGEYPGLSHHSIPGSSKKTPLKNLKKKLDRKNAAKAWVSTVTETLSDCILKKQWLQALQTSLTKIGTLRNGDEKLQRFLLRPTPPCFSYSPSMYLTTGKWTLKGGINLDNCLSYIDEGASHVIVSSYVFNNGQMDLERLKGLVNVIGKQRLVLDLSCRKKEDKYAIVTDRWQKFSDVYLDEEVLNFLARFADEFLVHGVDVEGKKLVRTV